MGEPVRWAGNARLEATGVIGDGALVNSSSSPFPTPYSPFHTPYFPSPIQ
ncbi:hypothetical protein [Nostoc sp.]